MTEDLFGSQKELSRQDKLRASRKLTNTFQTWVKDWLNDSRQFKVWRNNNIPSTRHEAVIEFIDAFNEHGQPVRIKTETVKVHFKKNQKEVSTLDLIGFRIRDGRHVEIEIKTGKDKLDADQQTHLNALQASGCISFATGDKHTFLQQIAPYMEEKKLAF